MTEQMIPCIAPGATSADDLVAYAFGEAEPAAVRHVDVCPGCRARAAAYAGMGHVLRMRLWRRACPEPLRIGELVLDLLPLDERMTLAAHVQECPRCQEERARIQAFLALPEEVPVPAGGLAAAVRKVFARPAPLASRLRGDGDGSRSYEAEGLAITISVQRGGRGHRGGIIAGLLDAEEVSFAAATARLLGDQAEAQTQPVDENGNFIFEDVPDGTYRIEITTADATIVIDSISVP